MQRAKLFSKIQITNKNTKFPNDKVEFEFKELRVELAKRFRKLIDVDLRLSTSQ